MEATLSLEEYLQYFMQKRDRQDAVNQTQQPGCIPPPSYILLATVFISEPTGSTQNIAYCKKIEGNKLTDPVTIFVDDLVGEP